MELEITKIDYYYYSIVHPGGLSLEPYKNKIHVNGCPDPVPIDGTEGFEIYGHNIMFFPGGSDTQLTRAELLYEEIYVTLNY